MTQPAQNSPDAPAVPEWSLGDRMRKAREHSGRSQQQMAAVVGISRRSVGAYESGASVPRRPVLRSWAVLARVDYDWLVGDPEVGAAGDDPATSRL